MSDRHPSLVEEALDAWRDAREGLIEEVRLFRDAEMDFRPADGSRTVRELIWHIVESARMWCGELPRADGDFTRQPFGDFVEEYASDVRRVSNRDGITELLRTSLDEGESRFREAGEDLMREPIRRFDRELWTRLTWMHHGIAHEMYHRGQLALYVRLLGRTPALTRRIGG